MVNAITTFKSEFFRVKCAHCANKLPKRRLEIEPKAGYGNGVTIASQSSVDRARIWLSARGTYGRIGGDVNWAAGEEPLVVEYLAGWPILKVRLVRGRRRSRVQTAMQIRKSSWHAHLPRERLGIPTKFKISAAASRNCLCCEGDVYTFDFTGMSPLPAVDDLERRAVVLLEEIENFRRSHPEVLDRLGIEVTVGFRDELE